MRGFLHFYFFGICHYITLGLGWLALFMFGVFLYLYIAIHWLFFGLAVSYVFYFILQRGGRYYRPISFIIMRVYFVLAFFCS